MNGKTQSSAAQMQHPQDGDNHGKHKGDTKGKHTGGKDEKREKKTDDGKK